MDNITNIKSRNKTQNKLAYRDTSMKPDERVRRQRDSDGRPTGSSSHSTE